MLYDTAGLNGSVDTVVVGFYTIWKWRFLNHGREELGFELRAGLEEFQASEDAFQACSPCTAACPSALNFLPSISPRP